MHDLRIAIVQDGSAPDLLAAEKGLIESSFSHHTVIFDSYQEAQSFIVRDHIALDACVLNVTSEAEAVQAGQLLQMLRNHNATRTLPVVIAASTEALALQMSQALADILEQDASRYRDELRQCLAAHQVSPEPDASVGQLEALILNTRGRPLPHTPPGNTIIYKAAETTVTHDPDAPLLEQLREALEPQRLCL